ncbi:ABC transporter [Herbaspirillum sp. BH-1]|uniref:Cholesterol transport system auxiliary component n=1 Tax=Herbaspirillum frisingense TaxID=92645 RepID=A0ABU1PAD9_9BURK|nr:MULTISPECIES: ABC-type transport auxiliary lipoprotein family protein [Herbaspirillum]MDR6582876.1 cholesterol transport system auxiliary component [Herbaspirillum frisingense]PLY60543.1 ABC transporter [Herbaspirillum sp. BH-1]
MKTLLLRTALVAGSLALTACSILPKADPLAVYRLPAPTVATPASTSNSAGPYRALRIVTPSANRSVDSERILVLPEGDMIKSYAGVRWSDPAPQLLRDRLLEAFQADGRFPQLSGDNANIAAEVELNGVLAAFQTEYRNGVPQVVIVYDARLVDTTTRQQLAARRFAVVQPVAGSKVPEVVTAFGAASERLAAEVVGWAAGVR